MLSASIVGGSGYAGGELLRLLLSHPAVEVSQVTSESYAGKYLHSAHPNLRDRTRIQFSRLEDLRSCDVLFTAAPHGAVASRIDELASRAERIVDLSADFRLRDAAAYQAWYGWEHPSPEWLDRFVYGLPELHRAELREARYASGVGCNATATILALRPFWGRGLIERVVVDLKVGSSEGGREPSAGSHHPERTGAVRAFAPVGHRHAAEVLQELGPMELHLTATAIEMVRGAVATAHIFVREPLDDRQMWSIFREAYTAEPFVRIVRDRAGVFRLPEPKILAGSNYCDVGFEVDPKSNRIVVVSAIDNLMKGAAGTAVQTMNLMCGFDETAGLEFAGLHPV